MDPKLDKQFIRDNKAQGKPRPCHDKERRRPIWKGPIPDRYYYMVKNKEHPTMSAYIVRFTDDPLYEPYVRQIVCNQGGNWSLIESDVSLPEGPGCKLRKHSRVEEIKDKLFWSHDRKIGLLGPDEKSIETRGTPLEEREVFE